MGDFSQKLAIARLVLATAVCLLPQGHAFHFSGPMTRQQGGSLPTASIHTPTKSRSAASFLRMQEIGGHLARPRGDVDSANVNRGVLGGPFRVGRRGMLALGVGAISLALTSNVKEANAAYGPAGASVRMSPIVPELEIEQYLDLDPGVQLKRGQALQGKSGRIQIQKLLGDIRALPPAEKISDYEKRIEKIEALINVAPVDGPEAIQLKKVKDSIAKEKDYFLLVEKIKERRMKREQQAQLESILLKRQEVNDALDLQPAWVFYSAAGAGSSISTMIMHPLDTLKIRLQSSEGNAPQEQQEDLSMEMNSAMMLEDTALVRESPNSVFGMAKEVSREIISLYDGLLPNIMKEAPSSAVYLGIYETFKTILQSSSVISNPLLIYLLAGASGELFGSVLRSPSEAIKINVQGGGMSASEAAKYVFLTKEGRKNTFTAWTATLIRDIPMGAVQIALFEGIKTYLVSTPNINFDVSSLFVEACIGSFAGMVGAGISCAPDVIITKINLSAQSEGKPMGVLEVAKDIYRTEGLAGFTTGIGERCFYWGPAIGIFLSAYCGIRQAALPH